MIGTSTITRSKTEAESDRDGAAPTYVLDKETVIITTADGENEQVWVLITCVALHAVVYAALW